MMHILVGEIRALEEMEQELDKEHEKGIS